MERSEKAIFTTMCMICDGDRVLVQDRTDHNYPGLCFPGGHVEPGESFVESVCREVLEETGLTVSAPQLCGVKQFLTHTGERYVVMLFQTAAFEGRLHDSEEGKVFWVRRDDLLQENTVEDLAALLQVFLADDLYELYYPPDLSEEPYRLL